jgi:[ribosomal protein S5]-alanine N-acetyltransferase
MSKKTLFETNRICFCEWSKHDFESFKGIATNPKVMKYIGTGELWSKGL